ncbi:MAG: PAS domain S-box protein [Blastocatellia bacterium]
MTRHKRYGLYRYGLAFASVFLVAVITRGLHDFLRETPFVLFIFAIYFATLYGGLMPGMLSAMMSGLAADLVMSPPLHPLGYTWLSLARMAGLCFVSLCIWAPVRARLRAEEKLLDSVRQLEDRVSRRTSDLAEANARLRTEMAEREKAQEALRGSEAHYRSLIEQASDLVSLIDPDGTVRYRSASMLERLGYSPEGEGSRRLTELIHPEDREKVREAEEKVRTGKESRLAVEYRVRHQDGSWRAYESVGDNRMDDPTLRGVLVVTRDITRRREAEEAIQYANRLANDTIRNAREGIVALDREMRPVMWNRRMREITLIPQDRAVGAHVLDLFPCFDTIGLTELYERALAGENAGGEDVRYQREDGSVIWISIAFAPDEDSAGNINGVIATVHDVTDRHELTARMNELLEREQVARAQAEDVSRMKDEFLATLSHELRTPLSAIIGWAQMLRDGIVPAEKIPQALETIERNASAQSQLIDDLLDVSRVISGRLRINPVEVDLAVVIVGAVSILRLAADARNIEISLDLGPETMLVTGDPDRLQQVVWNLLANAIKFTQPGGRVEIALEPAGTQALIAVRDNGQGIDPEFLPYVFERFSQADKNITRRHGGLGLGLAIVRHLVEMHGGEVRAHSEGAGKGAEFTVLLPASDRAAREANARLAAVQAAAAMAYQKHEKPLAGIRVMLVEDEPDILDMLAVALGSYGAEIVPADSAAAAMTLLSVSEPDVLVSDIGMPDEDGYSLLRRVRADEIRGQRLPAIALTAYARPEDKSKALAAGFMRHLAKPVDTGELIRAILAATGQRAPAPSAPAPSVATTYFM